MYECMPLIAVISGPFQFEMHSSEFNCFWNVLNSWVLIIECLIFKKKVHNYEFSIWVFLDFSTSPNRDWGVDLHLARALSFSLSLKAFTIISLISNQFHAFHTGALTQRHTLEKCGSVQRVAPLN